MEKRSLGNSLDALRNDVLGLAEDIKELYDLDDDNFHKICDARESLTRLAKRVDNMEKAFRRQRAKRFLGALVLTGGVYLVLKGIRETIDGLRKRVDELEKEKAQTEER